MPSTEARELQIYIENDGKLYDRHALPIARNMARHVARGSYDRGMAAKAWRHLADAGAKKYQAEFGTPDLPIFSVAHRNEAARLLRDSYAEHVRELALEQIGPFRFSAELFDWTHDVNGNPTSHVLIMWPEDAAARVEPGSYGTRGRHHRQQVGYSDSRADGVYNMIEKAGFLRSWYRVQRAEIDRYATSSIDLVRKPLPKI